MGSSSGGGAARVSAFLKAGSSAVISQVAAILLLPVLFRIYAPEDFGRWATLQAVILATASLSIFRYDLAIVTERDDARAGVLFWSCAGMALIVAALVGSAGLYWALASQGASWDLAALYLCGFWLLAAVLNQPLQAWLLRDGRFGAASASIITSTVGANLGQLIAAQWSADHRGLIAGSALGTAAGAIVAGLLCATNPPGWTRDVRPGKVFHDHRRFVFFSLPFTILSLARERAPVLILAALGTAGQVGAYSQAWRLAHIPAGLASSALRPVVFHAAARRGVGSVGELVQQLVGGMALLAGPWIGLVVAQPTELFKLLLGDAWGDAGVFAALLAAPAALFVLTNWLDRLLDVANRQDMNLKLEVLAAVLSVGAFSGALWLGANTVTATALQSLALILSYLTVLLVAYRVCGYPVAALLRALAAAFAAMLATAAVTWSVAQPAGAHAGLAAGFALSVCITGFVVVRLAGPLRLAIAGDR